MSRLERFCLGYVHGSLPPWVYSVFQSQQSVALYKTVQQDTVRPLGLKHPLIKVQLPHGCQTLETESKLVMRFPSSDGR